MKWNPKKFVAFVLTIGMVISPVRTAFAEGELEEGNGIGVGEMEGTIETDIYHVVMPTDVDGVFDFIMDPQSLINETDAAAYDGLTFEEDSTVFFRRLDEGAEEDYSSMSDAVKIVNKSSMAVDVTLKVEVVESSMQGITMTNDEDFTDDTSASLYLAVADGENVVPIGNEGAVIETMIASAPEGAYEYVYDSESGEYTYGLREDVSDVDFAEYSFQLMGAVNGKGDWSRVTDETPRIVVTWNVSPSIPSE